MARFDKLEFDGAPKRPASDAAQEERSSSTQSKPKFEPVDWMRRADEQRRNGCYENALRFYSRALEDDRTLVDGWLGQVQMLIFADECPEADLWARKAIELFPAHGDLFAGRAQALIRLGDVKHAHEMSDGAMRQPGQSAYRWTVRGEIMVARRQRTDDACFEKAWEADRDWLTAAEIALIYLRYDSPAKAWKAAQRATASCPTAFYPWLIQGRCESAMGLTNQARRSLERCMEICPNQGDAVELLRQTDGASFFSRLWKRLHAR